MDLLESDLDKCNHKDTPSLEEALRVFPVRPAHVVPLSVPYLFSHIHDLSQKSELQDVDALLQALVLAADEISVSVYNLSTGNICRQDVAFIESSLA